MKIFKNRKLFGKLNIIDLIILILFIVAALVIYVFLGRKTINLNNTNQKEYTFTIQIQKTAKDVADKIKPGDKIYDNENNSYIGEVVSTKVKEYNEMVKDNEKNEYVLANNNSYVNVNISIKNQLIDLGNNLVTSDDYKIKVGNQIYLRGNCYAGQGYVILIER